MENSFEIGDIVTSERGIKYRIDSKLHKYPPSDIYYYKVMVLTGDLEGATYEMAAAWLPDPCEVKSAPLWEWLSNAK